MKFLVYIFLIFVLASCSRQESNSIPETKAELRQDEAIISAPADLNWAFGRGYKNYTPSNEDIKTALIVLDECFQKETSGALNPFTGRKLDDYNKQFIGAEISGGDKVILINCFCKNKEKDLKNWKTEIVLVPDGENCFFRVTVNLGRKSYYNLMVNGF